MSAARGRRGEVTAMKTGTLMAGFGRSDITPRPGVALAGFGPYLNRNSTSVRQPLQARCALLQESGEPVLILSLELIGLGRELEAMIRQRIASECAFHPDRLCIVCTHTHSGPQSHTHIGWGQPDDLYLETLPGRILPAVELAMSTVTPVTVHYANPSCDGIAINRDLDAAYDRTMPVEERLSPDWRPARPELTEPRTHVLSFRDESRLVGVIHSFACHPVVCCESCTQIHGDFPGLASASLESRHPEATALFLPGALGDVNPSISHRDEDESYRALEIIGSRYADSVEEGLMNSRILDQDVLDSQIRTVVFPRVDWSLEDVETQIRDHENHLRASGLTDNPLAGGDNPLDRNGITMVRLAALRQLRAHIMSNATLPHPSRLQGIRIGPVRLLGATFEIYQSTRRVVSKAIQDDPVVLLSHVNGSHGYAPDPELYRKNRYASEFVTLMGGDLPYTCIHDQLVEELITLGKHL